MAITERRTITINQARDHLKDAFSNKLPVFLWGASGIGKSELVEQVCDSMGGILYDVRLPLMEPTDLRGMPFYNKELNKMDWAAPIDLPDQVDVQDAPIAVLFLDELNSAPPQVQASAYQLILNRRVGKYRLPDNVVIVAAGNRESDKGVTFKMPAPLRNRLLHHEIRVDHACWEDHAIAKGIHPDIVGYLGYAPQDLHNFNPNDSSPAFPSPRTWFYTDILLKDKNISEDRMLDAVTSAVGEGTAVKFMAHRKIVGGLPRPMDILSGNVTELNTKEISAMYSLTINLCYALNEINQKRKSGDQSVNWNTACDRFFEFMMKNFTTELTVMGAITALSKFGLPFKSSEMKSFDEFHKRFGKYIVSSYED